MNVQAAIRPEPVSRPDAIDIDSNVIDPRRDYVICNHLLDDHDALEAFYQDNGYLFFRQVLAPDSVREAREAMLRIAADEFGLIEQGDPEAKWNGKARPAGSEEWPCFAGISRKLVEHPDNQVLLAKILGDEPSMVPIVQYRLYPPSGAPSFVHQDGFYSPGIQDYKPLWVPLTPCPREVGGLMIAVGQHKKGFLHNVAKGAPFPIPADLIDPDSWTTIDFEPGDLLVIHPNSPHAGMPNRSDRLRVSFDTRVQSARNPTTFAATVEQVTPDSVTLRAEDSNVGTVTLSVDADTFIRVRNPGVKERFEDFATVTTPGMEIVAVRSGDRAVMLRMGSRP